NQNIPWEGFDKTDLFGEYKYEENDWHSGTNYAEAFKAANSWFDANKNGDNLLYFLTDGCPNKGYEKEDDKGEYTNGFHAVPDALEAFKELLNTHDDLKVHAIGIGGGEDGEKLTPEQMAGLAMFDNTGKPNQEDLGENEFGPTGVIYGNTKGDIAYLIEPIPAGNKITDLDKDEKYFVHVQVGKETDTGYFRLEYDDGKQEWGFIYYESSEKPNIWISINQNGTIDTNGANKNIKFVSDENYFYTAGSNLDDCPHGVSQIVSTKDELTAALGTIATNTVSDDFIDASQSDTLVNIIYGDVMNTDGIREDAQPGSGYQVFENKHWSDEQITSYVHDNAVALGSETLLAKNESDSYDTYYRDVYGDIYQLSDDGTPTKVGGSDSMKFISREGGNDTIFGTKTGDSIFGQEGNDILFGDGSSETLRDLNDQLNFDEDASATDIASAINASENKDDLISKINNALANEDSTGDDQLYGGSGDDLLFGMGGDDYLVGGEGEDILFGGAGNDIVVYDKNDVMVSGGSGIDFMVTTDENLTMAELEKGDGSPGLGPIVEGINVLLKGEDALSLTNMDQLASKYGITVEGNEIHLGEGWTKDTSTGSENTYTFQGDNDTPSLTMEVNLSSDDQQLQVTMHNVENGNG
ncbi:MAG TPA: hypothetical protein H9894_04745, partial [Candidatus Desulfovibrio intestinipullorum]|nr:hypothetical protein [Candidatus Desulfovibrio intestinipullorum]